jgi:hypothetical protein
MLRPRFWLSAAAILIAAAAAIFFLARYRESAAGEVTVPPAFDGDSNQLQRTVVVPTLDTPTPEDKSVVWCASFQLAWDKLKSDVVKGPVEITNADAVCDRLNKAVPVAGDLPPAGSYAAAGFEADGIRDTIHAEMARRFPDAPLPKPIPPGEENGILAWAYLEAELRFKPPFLVNREEFHFHERGKHESRRVKSFGVPRWFEHGMPAELWERVEILFSDAVEKREVPAAFVVDLDRHSEPNQLVLARVDRKATLAETLDEVQRRIRAGREENTKYERPLESQDTLLVPNMNWRLRHEFRELLGEGKALKFNGLWPMRTAEQIIALRLDQEGVRVKSSGEFGAKSAQPAQPRFQRDFHFDRPFLLYLKKRGAERPFFVMWIDNAELLCPT